MQFNYVLCYLDTNRKVTSYNLWENGISAFKNATFYKEWKRIKKLDPCRFEETIPYIKDSIMEKTRVITCFENFMKGQLILDEFLVHKISKKHKQLKKDQEDRPVKVSELEDDETFKYLNLKEKQDFDWSDFTIPFLWMIRDRYQDKINLPTDIIETLKFINSERNHLHFISSVNFRWGSPVVEQYEQIIHFVDETMSSCLESLKHSLESIRKKKRP